MVTCLKSIMSKSSRKRGRDPAVSVDDQVLELKRHKIFHENGELKTGKEYKNLCNTISANLKKKTGKKNEASQYYEFYNAK